MFLCGHLSSGMIFGPSRAEGYNSILIQSAGGVVRCGVDRTIDTVGYLMMVVLMMAVRLGLHALLIEFTEQNQYSGNLPRPSIPGVFRFLPLVKATSSVSTSPRKRFKHLHKVLPRRVVTCTFESESELDPGARLAPVGPENKDNNLILFFTL